MNLETARINTAGAFLCINGLYLFAIGIRPHHGHLPIVRLGGHREEGETGWECAVREIYEEAGLCIQPLPVSGIYLADRTAEEKELQLIHWRKKAEAEPDPFLVVRDSHPENMTLSVMYLAHAEGVPMPSSEFKRLLLLEKATIHSLCQQPITLDQYLKKGGRAILNAEFDRKLPLEPFLQLRLLSKILALNPNFVNTEV